MKKIPHTYVIIFILILIAAVMTWFVPSGEFIRSDQPTSSGRIISQIVPGTYHRVESSPQTWQIFSAFFKGFQKTPAIIAFILILGGAFWILNETNAINTGVKLFLNKSKSLEKVPLLKKIGVNNLIISLIMILFSLFGAVFGMSEETIAFAAVFVPLAISMGYDSITGICMCFLAAGLGFAGCMLNPFTLGIAQDIAGLKMFSGIEYRFFIWLVMTAAGIVFVLSYANKIKKNPQKSVMYTIDGYWRKQQQSDAASENDNAAQNQTEKRIALISLAVLAVVIITLIIGVTVFDWGFTQIAALFFTMAVVTGFVARKTPSEIAVMFINGCKDILSAALVVGLAGGIIVILEDGKIIDTVLYAVSSCVSGTGKTGALTIMYGFQTLLNAVITSGTAKAAMLMPMFREISSIVGLSLQSTVTAFHMGDGFTNLITPTSGVLIAVLGVAKIPYTKWVKFVWKFILIMIILGWILLLPTLFMNLTDF